MPVGFNFENQQAVRNFDRLRNSNRGGGGIVAGGGAADVNTQLIKRLSEGLTSGTNKANEANKVRFEQLQQLIAGLNEQVGGTFSTAENNLVGAGTSARNTINRGIQTNLAANEQDLISRGLGNTTVRSSTRQGIQEGGNRSLQALMEQLANQKTGLSVQKAGAQLDLGRLSADALLSREDQGPNMDTFLQLISQLARQGGQLPKLPPAVRGPVRSAGGGTGGTGGGSAFDRSGGGPGQGLAEVVRNKTALPTKSSAGFQEGNPLGLRLVGTPPPPEKKVNVNLGLAQNPFLSDTPFF